MVDKDIVLEKVKNIQNCLRRIHEETGDDPASLFDMDVQDIFVLNLQRAVQSCIDLAAHVVSDEGLGLPSDLKENFTLLETKGILSSELSSKLQKMVGFRNIAVHDYTAINASVLKSVLAKDLKDIEDFYTLLLKHFRIV